jgi:hypothetical protein
MILAVVGGTAHPASLQQREERFNRYQTWVNDKNTVFIPLRRSYVRNLPGDQKQKEKHIKSTYGGWYKRREKINGEIATIYYVPYHKKKYESYFYSKRWKHLAEKEQKAKWQKRMQVSEDIKRKIRQWLTQEERELNRLNTTQVVSFNGTWYLSGGANAWKVVLKQNGNKVRGYIYTKDVYGSEARVGKVNATVYSTNSIKGYWHWDYDPARRIAGLGENYSKDRLELNLQPTKSKKITIRGLRIDPPHRVSLQGSNEGGWY